MKRLLRKILAYVPEIILVIIVSWYWINSGIRNPLAPVLMGLLLAHCYLQRSTFALMVGALFLFLGFWISLAFVSDVLKLSNLNDLSLRFIFYGLFFCGSELTGATLLLSKFVKQKK